MTTHSLHYSLISSFVYAGVQTLFFVVVIRVHMTLKESLSLAVPWFVGMYVSFLTLFYKKYCTMLVFKNYAVDPHLYYELTQLMMQFLASIFIAVALFLARYFITKRKWAYAGEGVPVAESSNVARSLDHE